MPSIITNTGNNMKAILITILLALLIGGGGTFLWTYYGGFGSEREIAVTFIDVYGDYSEISNQVELLVHLPGTEKNTDRAELFTLLSSILTENMEAERREMLARMAYTNLNTIKKEIDSAQIAQADLYKVLQRLDNSSRSFSSIDLHNRSMKIVSMARKRTELSARITSVLSETNEQTYAILTRILADKGQLSQAHIVEINKTTNEAEERFDSLEKLYKELGTKKNEIETAFAEFAQVAI